MYRDSFTILELIIVLIVTGILAVVTMPHFEKDDLLIATEQVVRHIRYTQHLAMVNDVYDNKNPIWYKAMWRISFRSNNCYVVSSNTDFDMNYDREESAIDPLTKTLLYSNVPCIQDSTDNGNMFLSEKYEIDKIEFNAACGDNRFIAFDNLGRPHKTLIEANDLLKAECRITFHSDARSSVITILPETGYVKIFSIH